MSETSPFQDKILLLRDQKAIKETLSSIPLLPRTETIQNTSYHSVMQTFLVVIIGNTVLLPYVFSLYKECLKKIQFQLQNMYIHDIFKNIYLYVSILYWCFIYNVCDGLNIVHVMS